MTLPSSSGRAVRVVTWMYHGVLLLYPARFRAEYEQEMKTLFEERCLEAYEAAGSLGIGRWLGKILAREVTSIYKEYWDMAMDVLQGDREARRALGLGTIFLAGTWIALFFMAGWMGSGFSAGLLPGVILVLVNALLVARSLIQSEQLEYVAGMAATTNTFLLAGLMAVQASLGALPALTILVQVLLIGLHGLMLWRLRGEHLTQERLEMQKGE